MNRTEVETALAESVAFSCLECRPIAGLAHGDERWIELVVHTVLGESPASVDHGPVVVIGPFDEHGEVPGINQLFVGVKGDEGDVAQWAKFYSLAPAIEHVVKLTKGDENLAEHGQRLRAAVAAAAEMAWSGGALSEDWFGSILANLEEPPDGDEVGWAIIEHEREAALAALAGLGVTEHDLGYLAGMVTKYGRDAVLRAAQVIEAF